ncbi:MAG: hypothetical protein KGI84_10025, partial [Elusimicrobia bacterium]|nr:hypothetical protein [Elusimicrobiota bacterium]
MKILALASSLFMALAPTFSAAQASMPVPVRPNGLIREISDWQFFFDRNPKNAKKAGDFVSQLRELLGEAEQARQDADIAPVTSRFEEWQSAVLAKLSDKDRAANKAGFERYMKYLVASAHQKAQAEKEEKRRQKLAEAAETAELNAVQVPERAFDGGAAAVAAVVPAVVQASAPEPPRPALLDAYAPEVQPLSPDTKLIPQPVIASALPEPQSYSCEN